MTAFLPRSAWTNSAPGGAQLAAGGVVGIAVHYPADGNVTYGGLSQAQVAQKLNAYRNHHVNGNKWADIGYNIAIDQAGRVWDCRWPGRVGAHAEQSVAGTNKKYIGVLFIVGNNEGLSSAAVQAFRDLRAVLLRTYPNAKAVIGHQQVPGNSTGCPGAQIMSAVRSGALTGSGSVPAPAPAPAWDGKTFPGAGAFRVGQSHPAVTVLGQRLVAHGFGGRYKVGPGPEFSEVDRLATQDFQRAQGWSGSDADGYPGPETWKRLMAAPAAPPKPAPVPAGPVVSLAKLIEAARTDTARPQGGQTPGAAASVRVVEDALRREGLLAAQYANDGSFGSSSVKAYAGWQARCGYRGKDADGIPGYASLVKLSQKYGFRVGP